MNKISKSEYYSEEREKLSGFGEPDLKAIFKGGQALAKAPQIYGVPTGINGLDELFFLVTSEKGNIVKKPLGVFQLIQFLI